MADFYRIVWPGFTLAITTHHALIVSIKGNHATIYDDVLNRSYAVDPVTKKPGTGSNQADREKNIYFLRKIQGVWKVTEVLRQKG